MDGTMTSSASRASAIPRRRTGPTIRHPRKPDWIRVKAPISPEYHETRALMRELKLNTVCEEAACPNIGECWKQKHATVMILGAVCTRACAFCNVATGQARPARSARARARRRGGRRSSASAISSSPRSTATISTMAAPGISSRTIAAIRARRAGHDDRGADARFPAQGRARSRRWSRRGPTSSTTISRPCRGSMPRCGRARAISPRCGCSTG